MNFKLTKGDNFWDKKQRFIELYNLEVLAKDIQENLELSINQYNKLVRECASEEKITPRRKKHLEKGKQ